jgi:regulator of protease activity HflC (stomatin/prohibitin superfamily)
MLGFAFLKAKPTTFVAKFQNGRAVRQGAGLSFFYFAPTCTIVSIELSSADVPFVFEETTTDFQEVTVQGQLTYRVLEPMQLAKALDFSIDRRGRYVSDDPTKLSERLIQATQAASRAFVQSQDLSSVLTASDQLGTELTQKLLDSTTSKMLGVEILSVSVLSIKASPEMVKAMQADTREKLLLKADQAVYARRNMAIDLEREITENQLQSERAVEEKRREVSETKMAASIAIEEQRSGLVDRQISNERKLAEARTAALQATLDAMRGIDWRVLATATGNNDARSTIAMAFQQLAENADKIGRLEITPDLLRTLTERDVSE